MQAGWMSLLAAAVGAVSALLINWLTRRSERKREDIRWEREAAERSAQRDHDSHIRWREHRVETYGNYLAAIDTFMTAVRMLILTERMPPEAAEVVKETYYVGQLDFPSAARLLDTAMNAGAPVAVTGTKEVRDAAQKLIDECVDSMTSLSQANDFGACDETMPMVKTARVEFLGRVRDEFRIDTDQKLTSDVSP